MLLRFWWGVVSRSSTLLCLPPLFVPGRAHGAWASCALMFLHLTGPQSCLWSLGNQQSKKWAKSHFVRVGCCLPAFWNEHVLGGVRVWILIVAVLLLWVLTQPGEIQVWWWFSEGLRETLLLGVWRCDWELPQIWDKASEAGSNPFPVLSAGELYLSKGWMTPAQLCAPAALAPGTSSVRYCFCLCEEGGKDF